MEPNASYAVGNFKSTQGNYNGTYPVVRKRFNQILGNQAMDSTVVPTVLLAPRGGLQARALVKKAPELRQPQQHSRSFRCQHMVSQRRFPVVNKRAINLPPRPQTVMSASPGCDEPIRIKGCDTPVCPPRLSRFHYSVDGSWRPTFPAAAPTEPAFVPDRPPQLPIPWATHMASHPNSTRPH